MGIYPEVLAGPRTELFPLCREVSDRACYLRLGPTAVVREKAAGGFYWLGLWSMSHSGNQQRTNVSR